MTGGCAGSAGGKTDVTPTFWCEEQDRHGHPVGRWGCQALVQERYREPDEFKIGGGQRWVAADEGDGLVDAGGEHPLTREQEPGQLDPGLGREQRDRLRAVNGDTGGQVVLQVRADTHQLMARLDSAARSWSGSPMPESMSSCGELMVPALRITSWEAVSRWVTPAASRYSTPMARFRQAESAGRVSR